MTQVVKTERNLPFWKKPITFNLIVDFFIIAYVISVYTFSYNELNFISKALALVLMGLLAIYALKKGTIRFDGLGICLGLFTMVCMLSCLWAVDMSAAMTGTTTMVQIFILVALLYNYVRKEEKTDFFISVMCIAATVFAIYTVLYFGIDNYFRGLEEGERIGTGINNVNAVGMMSTSAFLLNLWYAFYRKKWFYLLTGTICLVVMLGSGSRTATIGLILGTVALFVLKGKGRKRFISLLQCMAIMLLLYLILQLPSFDVFRDRFNQMIEGFLGSGVADNSAESRFDMIELGLKSFAQRPFTGVGIRNSNAITQEIGLSTYLHNNYVELLATVGIFGTIFYYLMFLMPFGRLIKNAFKQNHYAIIGAVLLGVNLVFQFGVVDYYNKVSYLYVILFWLIASRIKEKPDEVFERAI